MSPRQRQAWLAIGLLLLLGACRLGARAPAAGRETWWRVTRQDLVLGIEVTGTLKAVRSDSLGPPALADVWEFKISSMVPEGSEVKKGTPVLAFDTTRLLRELDSRIAESDSARTEIEKTRADLRLKREKDAMALAEAQARFRKASIKLGLPTDLVGANDRRQASIEAELAHREARHLETRIEAGDRAGAEELASLRSKEQFATGRVREIQSQIDRMTVRAPRNGTVIYVPNWRGEKKKVGDSVWREGERVMEIPDLSEMMAFGEVDEADCGRVAIGRRVRLRLDAHPDQELTGVVKGMGRGLERSSPRSPLKVLKLKIALDRTDPARMRPGMRFRGEIEHQRIRQAVVVPLEAVAPTAAAPLAIRKTLLSREEVALRLGARNDRLVEVLSGLEPGHRVLVHADQGQETQRP